MDIDDVQIDQRGKRAAPRFIGRLRMEAQAAHDVVAPHFRNLGFTALLQEDRRGVALEALPGVFSPAPSRLWVALLLFALTIVSTIAVGGQDLVDGQAVFNWGYGLSYSAALLGILLAHELGHYIVARRAGVAVSYPFFIPLPPPVGILGTMGAFISIKEPVPNRRTLLAIAIAGPLAGLAVTIPVLLIGLSLSEVHSLAEMRQAMPGQVYFTEGNSLIYAAAKLLVFGRVLPGGGEDVFLHPVAMAGWAGLLVTGLNLIPAGQLDGGHIFFSLFGPRAAQIASMIIAVLLLAMGFIWSGWFLWAVLVALLGRARAPLRNEVTPLDGRWRLLAIAGLIVFVLVFTPVPITIGAP
ncbi:site-2 protease family protein [Oscillochloris sp. ZM17-4]|uniref:site-2 protease family protein n=1 Tax=Oscillochloris sp. ZM17-4 TaxID=2866714 RepID=UPI0021081AE8|nr:site-2 protease family protein [Oscillochloris sp. ZM17-4]